MKQSRFALSLLFGASLIVAACGGSDSPAGGAGGDGGDGVTSTGTNTGGTGGTGGTDAGGTGGDASSSSTSSTSGGGGGDPVGDGNDTPETAEELTGAEVEGDFYDVTKDVDYYVFTGTKGDPVVAYTDAKVGDDSFDPAYADTIVTLYDSEGNQIAQNDDPNPRYTNDASLYTVLPADGDYYVRVAECNAVYGEDNCAPADGVTDTSYTLNVGVLNPESEVVTNEGPEADNGAIGEKNPAIGFGKGTTAGSYYMTTVYGMFDTTNDVDVYSIKLPADLGHEDDAGVMASVYVSAHGSDGNGSSAAVGKIWLTDADGNTIAKIDTSSDDTSFRQLSPVLAVDVPYYLFVERAAAPATLGNDFYFLQTTISGSNPLETDDAGNDTAPEGLTAVDNPPGKSYFIDGTLSDATDVDLYSVAVPSGATKVSVVCGAARQGSAIQGLKAEVLNGAASVASKSEDATGLVIDGATIPTGATTLTVKFTGASLDADVSSAFYRCGVHVE